MNIPPVRTAWCLTLGIIVSIGLYGFQKIRPGTAEWINLGLLLPLILFIESLIQFFGDPIFRMIYLPFIVIISSYFSLRIIASCMLAVFSLGTPTLWWISGYATQGGIYLSLFTTGLISYYFFCRKTRASRKAVDNLEKLKSSALHLEASTDGSLFDEDRFSSIVKSVLETRKELDEILKLAKKIINTDSVTLFLLEGNNLVMKASTENTTSEHVHIAKGYLTLALKDKRPLIQPELKGKSFDPGYTVINEIGSFLCVPVLDGEIPIGVFTLESRQELAFEEREKDIAMDFARLIKEKLEKARRYIEIERFAKGFKSIHEASKTLSTSLRVEEIAGTFVELASGMVASSMVGFFIADRGRLKVIAKKGFEPESKSFYSKGTYFDLIIKNKQSLHFSNMNKKKGVHPFRTNDTQSFLGIPIISENQVIGVLAVASKEPDAISPFQGHLLNIVADQAAMSIINAQLHKEVERLAVTDGLTGLNNHRHFQIRLSEEFQRLERMPQQISLMIIDIDHFKKINDKYGHPVGDAVLSNLALVFRKMLRGIDILARYGGEEFAAVLIGTDSNGAKKMAERLRTYVLTNPSFVDENKISLTLSIGIATHDGEKITKDQLIERADQALYYAKNNGRNQVCLWKDISKDLHP